MLICRLTRIAGIEQPSVAPVLAQRERDDLIHRQPVPDDACSRLVSLTGQAIARLGPGRAVLRAVDDEACSTSSVAERATLSDLLEKLVRHMDMTGRSSSS